MRVLFIALSLLFYQVSFAGPDSTVIYGGIKSSYTLGNDVVSSKAPVFQGGVTFTSGSNYLDLWGSHPINSVSNNPYGKEVDVTVGHHDNIGNANVLVALAHYNLYPVYKMDGNDIFDVFGEVSPKESWHTTSPYLKIEVLNSSGFKLNNAIVTSVGLRKNDDFGNNWSVAQQLQLGHQPAIPGSAGAGTIGYYKAGVSKKVGKGSVGVSYERYQPFGMDAGRGSRNVGGINFAVSL